MAPFLEQELRNASFTNMAKRCVSRVRCLLGVEQLSWEALVLGALHGAEAAQRLLHRHGQAVCLLAVCAAGKEAQQVECTPASPLGVVAGALASPAVASIDAVKGASPWLWGVHKQTHRFSMHCKHSCQPESLAMCAGRHTTGCCWTC